MRALLIFLSGWATVVKAEWWYHCSTLTVLLSNVLSQQNDDTTAPHLLSYCLLFFCHRWMMMPLLQTCCPIVYCLVPAGWWYHCSILAVLLSKSYHSQLMVPLLHTCRPIAYSFATGGWWYHSSILAVKHRGGSFRFFCQARSVVLVALYLCLLRMPSMLSIHLFFGLCLAL